MKQDKALENILDMIGTIRRLERQQETEPDPRVRFEIAETLDMLTPSLDRMLDKYTLDLEQQAAGKKGVA